MNPEYPLTSPETLDINHIHDHVKEWNGKNMENKVISIGYNLLWTTKLGAEPSAGMSSFGFSVLFVIWVIKSELQFLGWKCDRVSCRESCRDYSLGGLG